jgi:hypothetical protein
MNGSGGSPRKIPILAVALGLAGVATSYFTVDPPRFWANWVFWFLMVATVGLGALFIVAVVHLVGARWSVPLRRASERVSSLAVLAAPVALVALFALPVIYPWVQPDTPKSPIVEGKAAWLNVPFFDLRTAICVGLWCLAYRVLVAGSIRQDTTRDPAITVRARRFAPVFMIFFALTITVVAFDWVSSLEPEWFSDIFGVYLFAGAFLSGLAASTLAALHLKDKGRLPGVRYDHIYNLGAFLFAFTVFWSYIGFAQYMLIWYANVPEEVSWYQDRLEGPWLALTLALAVLHFIVPFFALIARDAKGNARRLRWVAVLVLVSHALDIYWLVFPSIEGMPILGWPEAAFAVFFLGAAFAWVGRVRGADMPVGDPFLKEGLEFRL